MSLNSGSGSSTLRNLNDASPKLVKSAGRLSSGARIQSPPEERAGRQGPVEDVEAQAKTARKGIDNARYAHSALSIAEVAVGQVKNITDRLGELARQSAESGLDDNQREEMQKEFSKLTREIDRISETTQFNGVNLLQGEGFKVPVSDSSNSDRTIEMEPIRVSAEPLSGHNISSRDSAKAAMTAIGDLRRNLGDATSSIGAIEKKLESAGATESVAVENRIAADSRLRDVEHAAQLAETTSLSIRQNAGVAMQAHAGTEHQPNQQMFLSLLK